jgi:hypothetical protein
MVIRSLSSRIIYVVIQKLILRKGKLPAILLAADRSPARLPFLGISALGRALGEPAAHMTARKPPKITLVCDFADSERPSSKRPPNVNRHPSLLSLFCHFFLLDKKRQTVHIMADAPVTLRTRKFIRNPLLARKQMVL